MQKKICTKCNIEKPISEFSLQLSHKDNHRSACKLCMKIYRNINAEKIKKQQLKYYINNREYVLNRQQQKRIKNKYKINKLKIQRRKNNVFQYIQHSLACRIRNAIKGLNKSLSTMFLIGCEIDYLMHHIQEQFQTGMTWDNYGDWHIDHIRPCASFDLSNPIQQQECFHYTNLQPLWAIDNLRKGCK